MPLASRSDSDSAGSEKNVAVWAMSATRRKNAFARDKSVFDEHAEHAAVDRFRARLSRKERRTEEILSGGLLSTRDGEVVLKPRERGRQVDVGRRKPASRLHGPSDRQLCELAQLSNELEWRNWE